MFHRMVDLLHTTFCPLDHNEKCPYHQEAQLEGDPWTKPAHQDWLGITDAFQERYTEQFKEGLTVERFRAMFSSATRLMKKEPDHVVLMLRLLLSRRAFWAYTKTKPTERPLVAVMSQTSGDEQDPVLSVPEQRLALEPESALDLLSRGAGKKPK